MSFHEGPKCLNGGGGGGSFFIKGRSVQSDDTCEIFVNEKIADNNKSNQIKIIPLYENA